MTLTDVAFELYGLAPAEFITARDAAAKLVRSTDRALADEVKALRKPSAAAWAVNLLARSRGSLLDEVLALGVSLRQAQAGLQGEELRTLNRQRRQLVAGVVGEVRTLAAAAGVRLTDAVARQVEETLTAAMVDETAAAAVHSGMLTEALSSTGMGSLAIGSVVGVIPGRLHVVPQAPPDESEERERAMKLLEKASALLADAEARLDKAEKKRAKREARTLQLQAELDEVRRRQAELEHDLDRATDDLDAAQQSHVAAAQLRDEAKAAAVDAAKLVARKG
jgi:hypothetical protein